MNATEFAALAAEGYNRVPVVREVLADLDTPLSTYLKLADAPYSYLLESVHGGEKWGRYSIIGLPARTVLRVRGHEVTVERGAEVVERAHVEDPLAWIEVFQRRYRVPDNREGLPRFAGGLVGYFGYDTIRYVEPRLAHCPNPDPIGAPDILLMVSEDVVVFDNLSGKLYVIAQVDPLAERAWERAQAKLDAIVERLRSGSTAYAHGHGAPLAEQDFVSGFTQAGFEAAVERIKDYILAGDCMQVVPSQRLSAPYAGAPLDLYRALRSLNPSPYMYFLNLGDCHIVGSSPEILARLEDGTVTVRPIAGTRKRGATLAEDEALAADLLADPKERAEHLMLLDLGRNDLGRVAKVGSVRVTDRFIIERYSHVMHIVSNVEAELRDDEGAPGVLRATFPAGTVSGAPKVRAMEIIDELEPSKRGVYAGSVGYLGFNGDMDLAIAIRTAVIKDGRIHVQAGAGIVADSDPDAEWQETLNKARAQLRAAEMAEAGLDTRFD